MLDMKTWHGLKVMNKVDRYDYVQYRHYTIYIQAVNLAGTYRRVMKASLKAYMKVGNVSQKL